MHTLTGTAYSLYRVLHEPIKTEYEQAVGVKGLF